MAYTVKAVAELAGISVRTLHHYDDIGLLRPSQLSPAGYRLYEQADLERLQQILFFRELGFALSEIKDIVNRPGFDRRQALLDHRQLLQERQARLSRLVQVVDQTLAAMERGQEMDAKDMFDGFDPTQYEEEARQRWGHTKAYQESAARTKRYTKEDWAAIQAESRAIEQGLAALMEGSPADAAVQALVHRHHQQINDRFYTCPPQMYRGLSEMWVQDPRFTAHFDATKPGLAQFMHAAVAVYCDKLEGK